MKTTYKNILKSVVAAICAAALIATCCEYQDGSIGLWNLIALAVFAITAKILDKLATNTK